MTVENEWHGFDRKRHDRIHPKLDDRTCLMCEIERLDAELTRYSKIIDAKEAWAISNEKQRDDARDEVARLRNVIEKMKRGTT